MRLEWKYAAGAFRKNPWHLLKESLYFIVIFWLVGVFATMTLLPYENHKLFIRHSNHGSVAFGEPAAPEDPSRQGYVMNATLFARPINSEKQAFFHTVSAELYMVESDFDPEQSYFTHRNLLKGSYDDVIRGDRIAISYHAAKVLQVKVGDPVYLKLYTEPDGIRYHELKVGAILRSGYMYEDGRLNLHRSKALIHVSASDIKDSLEFQEARMVSFSPAESIGEQGHTRLQEWKGWRAESDPVNIFIDIAVPVLSVILMFVILRRESEHFLRQRKRDYGILIMLGKDRTFIRNVTLLEFMTVMIAASIIGSLLYKYSSEAYMQELVPWGLWLKVVLGQCLLGLAAILLTVVSQYRKLSGLSPLEFIRERSA